jgi:Uma2 family endonuclease
MVTRITETAPRPYFTADMVRSMPDDGTRYEVVYGELLVTPAPRLWHQVLVNRLSFSLTEYLRMDAGAMVLTSPADISWDRDVLVQPDVFVVPLEQARAMKWTAIRELLLVAEVLSPSNAEQDRFLKRRRYQEAGVPLYWIVDGEARQVEVWTPTDLFPRIERQELVWQPSGPAEPFRLDLSELFRAV